MNPCGLLVDMLIALQGYIWMTHRSPASTAWDLASHSMSEWKRLLLEDPGLDRCIEWQEKGSLLLATSPEESALLWERQHLLSEHGLESAFLEPKQVSKLEPALRSSSSAPQLVCGGLLAATDAQMNGRLAASALLDRCKQYSGLLHLMMDEPVERLLTHPASSCLAGVQTSSKVVGSRLGTVVAAGVWSGLLLQELTGQAQWARLLQPRRGHLLEVVPSAGMPALRHGIMEMSYTKHYEDPGSTPDDNPQDTDITFTATCSAAGSLLIGSSRELGSWSLDSSSAIVQAIMERACLFLPDLRGLPLPQGADVRVGLRPYAAGGLPMIGPIPDAPGFYLAAGHEGSGLCLGPATAQLVCHHLGMSQLSPMLTRTSKVLCQMNEMRKY